MSLEDAQAQYESMKWPEVRAKIESQTAEIAADVEMRQQLSMKDHLAQVEAFANGSDSLQIETTLVQKVNAQKNLLEEAQQSNELFSHQHADVCREKQQLRQQANEIEYLIRLLT